MVVSGAFRELAEILECFERADTEVQAIEIQNDGGSEEGEIHADLTLRVPVLAVEDLRDEITIEASNAELQGTKIDVALSVTIPTDDIAEGENGILSEMGGTSVGSNVTTSTGKPPYKDPEILRTVYEEYDTFPAMTEALNVDVTSETVRRYMVKHGIHNPAETDSQQDSGSEIGGEHSIDSTGDQPTGQRKTAIEKADTDAKKLDETTEKLNENAEISVANPEKPDRSETEDRRVSTATEQDEIATADDADEPQTVTTEAGAETESGTDIGTEPAAKILAEAEQVDTEGPIVADGIGISPEVTVADLADIIEEARTVYEVKNRLGLDHDQTRRLLNKVNLIEFVTGRMARQQIEVTPEEVYSRINTTEPASESSYN